MEKRMRVGLAAVGVAAVLVVSSLVLLGILAGNSPATTAAIISLDLEGNLAVGSDIRMVISARARPGLDVSSLTTRASFLSLDVTTKFQIRAATPDFGDDPWQLPNLWNVTNQDWVSGIAVVLETTAVYAGEGMLTARMWQPQDNDWSSIQVDDYGGLVYPGCCYMLGVTYRDFTILEQSPATRGPKEDIPQDASFRSDGGREGRPSVPEYLDKASPQLELRPMLRTTHDQVVEHAVTPADQTAGRAISVFSSPGPDPLQGTVTVVGRFFYWNVVTDDEAGPWLPQTTHPYDPNTYMIRQIQDDGAARIWLWFSQIQIGNGDHLYIRDGNGNLVQDFTEGPPVPPDTWIEVPGDFAEVEFTSDNDGNQGWGFDLRGFSRDNKEYGTKWAKVELWEEDGLFDTLVGAFETDAYGNIPASSYSNDDGDGTGLDFYLIIYTTSYRGEVVREWSVVYAAQTETLWDLPDGTLNFEARGPLGSDWNSGFIVYTTLMDGWDYMKYGPAQYEPPFTRTFWTHGHDANYGACPPCTDSSTTHYHAVFPHEDEIHIAHADAQSTDAVLHEYGHHVMANAFGIWSFGYHDYCVAVAPDLAWYEGWSDFFPAPVQAYTGRGNWVFDLWSVPRPLDLEWTHCSGGDTYEGSIAPALYDIFDITDDDMDTYDGSFLSIWRVITSGTWHFAIWWGNWKAYWTQPPSPSAYDVHYPKVAIYQNGIDYDEYAPWVSNFRVDTPPDMGYYHGTVQFSAEIGDGDWEDAYFLNLKFQYWDGTGWITFDDTGTVSFGTHVGFWDTTAVSDGTYSVRALVTDHMEFGAQVLLNPIEIKNHVYPATDVWANLCNGPFWDKVCLSWSHSQDPLLDHYKVCYGNVYDKTANTYTTCTTPLGAATNYHEFPGQGDGDPLNYFYVVRAFDMLGNGDLDQSANQAGKYVRQVPADQHLVSTPLVQQDTRVEMVFRTIVLNLRGAWTYDCTDAVEPWKHWNPGGGGTFTNMDHRMGAWVDLSIADSFVTAGQVPDATVIDFCVGWNMFGFPSFHAIPPYTVEIFKAVTGATRVQTSDPSGNGQIYDLLDDDPMRTGWGYWAFLPLATQWVIDQP